MFLSPAGLMQSCLSMTGPTMEMWKW